MEGVGLEGVPGWIVSPYKDNVEVLIPQTP